MFMVLANTYCRLLRALRSYGYIVGAHNFCAGTSVLALHIAPGHAPDTSRWKLLGCSFFNAGYFTGAIKC